MSPISKKTERLLVLSMLRGVGPSTLRRAAALPHFESLPAEELSLQIPAVSKSLSEPGAWDRALAQSVYQIEEAIRWNARVISPLDSEYPRLLAETKDDPFLLFVLGRLATDSSKSVAIIGTREPTEHGTLTVQRITKFFATERWSVVSGLALGCDGLAHQAAIESGGHTVAVMAHGLHMVAPARHRKLAENIIATGGALVSEYRFGQGAQPQQFVKRDRIQAGMGQGVVMIQSDLTGGSLHASRAALEYRRWLAIPYPTERDRAKSEPKIQANLLIADGATEKKLELLRCNADGLARVSILRSRVDYSALLQRENVTSSLSSGSQGTLF